MERFPPGHSFSNSDTFQSMVNVSKKSLIDLKLIEELASMGCWQKEIAETLGISIQTWHTYLNDPKLEVLEAYKRGVSEHRKIVMGGLKSLAAERHPAALIFLSKAHFGRRDNIDLTLRGDPDAPVEINVVDNSAYANMTSEERRNRIKELEEKKKLQAEAK